MLNEKATVTNYKKALESADVMPFVNAVMQTDTITSEPYGSTLFAGNERLCCCPWYPVFVFKLGYAQALNDIQRIALVESGENSRT